MLSTVRDIFSRKQGFEMCDFSSQQIGEIAPKMLEDENIDLAMLQQSDENEQVIIASLFQFDQYFQKIKELSKSTPQSVTDQIQS
jgi:hypothetical protein